MSKAIQAVRGMNDLLPAQLALWQRIEQAVKEALAAYGYQEIRFPIVEKTDLYRRSIGDVTDIVEKEMYTFEDRNGDSLTLRPEGTAGCVRAGIENGILYNQIQRLWYQGPMFRHERPQKGRYRQFHQIGVEAFGMSTPDLDAELILLSTRIWRDLGLRGLQLQLNTLGTLAARHHFRTMLVNYFRLHDAELDDDSRRRLDTNPLRILDSKNPALQGVIAGAPGLHEHLDDESRQHFEQLRGLLDAAGVSYVVNPRLVRGLDYYSRTVFEWVTTELGAQGTVCAGGRYDGLVEQLGGQATPAAGFALGLERLAELAAHQNITGTEMGPQIYVLVLDGAEVIAEAMQHAELLRQAGWKVELNCGGGSLKSQLKRADRSGATYAVILGKSENAAQPVTIRKLRGDPSQVEVPLNEVASFLKSKLDK